MIKDLIDIYLIFFRMGAVTFGGGYAMLPFFVVKLSRITNG